MTGLRAHSYTLVLPPGFVLVPVQGDTKANVATVLRGFYGKIADDRMRGRVRMLERSLVHVATQAKDKGVVDLVLPLGVPWQAPVSLSCTFAPALLTGPAVGPDATEVTTRAGQAMREVVLHEADAQLPDLDGLDLPGGSGADSSNSPLRTVHHVWEPPVPDVGRLIGTFTIAGSDDPELAPLVDALTELGDTIMSSLAWRGLRIDGGAVDAKVPASDTTGREGAP
ncbi:hypothetical protein [Promicromonospora iranensis]|jgi:hypothetical protein|uniref:hypothetical protein n=1 Tax=Promicromonospora iranensis TaxID=1105144 RepID=UPI0023A965F3|nr:hypothetical protein [Promicromonospora iranensis]